jgi:predicted MFS family arabinose efflux permease
MSILFFLILFMIGTDTFLISPLIPTLQMTFHVPTESSGWMMGSYTLGAALFALIAGPLSDGWNRKKVMFAGLLSFSLSTLLCGFATGFWSMVSFRFLAGVSAAFVAPQVWAAIPSVMPPHKVSKTLGVAYAGLTVSQICGVPIGSMLAVHRWSYPFLAIGVGSLLLAVTLLLVLPDIRPKQEQGTKAPILSRYVPILASSKARGIFLAYFFIHLGSNAAFAFAGKWLTDSFELRVDEVGRVMLFLGIGNLAGSLCSAHLVKLATRSHTLFAAVALLAAGFIVLPRFTSVVAVTGGYLAIFTILGILFPVIIEILTSLNPAIRGTISSLASSTMNMATTLGALAAGGLYSFFHGFAAVGVFSAVSFAASLIAFIASGVMGHEVKAVQEPAV